MHYLRIQMSGETADATNLMCLLTFHFYSQLKNLVLGSYSDSWTSGLKREQRQYIAHRICSASNLVISLATGFFATKEMLGFMFRVQDQG